MAWLTIVQRRGKYSYGCTVCRAAGLNTSWGRCQLTSPLQCQKVILQRHARSKGHGIARDRWRQGSTQVLCAGNIVPSRRQFKLLVDAINKGRAGGDERVPGVGKRCKVRRMRRCLGMGAKRRSQRFIRKCKSLSLMQDVRHGKLGIRFKAATPTLENDSGFLGILDLVKIFNNCSAESLQKGTVKVLAEFATSVDYSNKRKRVDVDNDLLLHMSEIAEVFCADGAADEQLAGRLLQGGRREDESILSNLLLILKDKAHAARRLATRGWKGFLRMVFRETVIARLSPVQMIRNSVPIKGISTKIVHENDVSDESVV